HRGNFAVYFTFVKENRFYANNQLVIVPRTDKQLDIEFETFRNKLNPGQQEEWKIKIKGPKGEKVAAEMLATLYDASLDAFRANNWALNIYQNYYANLLWRGSGAFNAKNSRLFHQKWNVYPTFQQRKYDRLNWFGFNFYGYYGYRERGARYLYADADMAFETAEAEETVSEVRALAGVAYNRSAKKSKDKNREGKPDLATGLYKIQVGEFAYPASGVDLLVADETLTQKVGGLSAIKARTNFNETAFFYPHLQTNEKGEIVIKFTIPEALTKWKFMGLAHTKDLKTGQIFEETVTQKELMIMPNAPRFFREGDRMTFTAKISNLSEKDINGQAELTLYDALTMKEITHKLVAAVHGKFPTIGYREFTAKKDQSTVLKWEMMIPDDVSAITYKVVAKAGKFSDGEEMAVPVLTNRMLVTESLPLPVKGNESKEFRFEKLINSGQSKTLKHHKLTLEYTSNPAWYAIQALPYMMEYPYECSEQIFSRFYANSIASHIANSSPKIKAVFDSWKSQSPEALLSNLEKNQELKSLMLEETPWVLDAKNETERKKRVGVLFDLNKMANELGSALKKLEKAQVANGGWTWFPGMKESRYITQHIVTGFGHLDHLGVENVRKNPRVWRMVKKAIPYLDNRIREDYDWVMKHAANPEDDHIGHTQIQYLYARSYFKDIKIGNRNQKAFDYYFKQAKKYWVNKSRYMQGMIALGLHRYDEKTVPADIMKSLKENAIFNEEMGMYWKENYGYYWYQAPIESQALMVEAFDEVANDQNSVNELKVWLLKQKQTTDWKTTKATAEACYALLLKGADWLASDDMAQISLGEMKINPKEMDDVKVEAGTGYFKTSWGRGEIKPEMGEVKVIPPQREDGGGVSWGALYWQYFEQLDKITPHETPLKLKKQLFIEKSSDTGPVITPISEKTKLQVGDKIKVRIELRVDRNMEFVHMKDMRASGFEPINVISRYKWQDGLGYYESTKDAATNFFFDRLPKGTYVFEYPLRVTHEGNFSNGITTIQCMYAPEFASHSEGIRVKVGQ
ncbi:hypothetical protein JYU20_03095, partial [Bacteroidales bacterium AH-315-I05]|nr:hypothetical protein [Bacteroidales bacterium AH-315-I05]